MIDQNLDNTIKTNTMNYSMNTKTPNDRDQFNQSLDKLSLINLKLNSTMDERGIIQGMSNIDVERLTAQQQVMEAYSKNDLNSTAKPSKIYMNTLSPSKFRKTVEFSPDKEFEQSGQRIFKNQTLDLFRQQTHKFMQNQESIKNNDHFAKAQYQEQFENMDFKIGNHISSQSTDTKQVNLGSVDSKVNEYQNKFMDQNKEKNALFENLDDIQNKSQAYADNTMFRNELQQYDFWRKLADLETVGEDEYEEKLSNLRVENNELQNNQSKADSWLKKTFEDNSKHGKFMIDDGEFDVDFDWLASCNQLIEDQDKGFQKEEF